jgi:hypothetical protein
MTQPAAPLTTAAKKPEWAPRMWQGCDFVAWMRLLARNRFAVDFRFWYIAVLDTFASLLHTALWLLEKLIYGRAIRKVELTAPPIFILGHWRTGTTLLHELMICDERFGFPTTYQCMDPSHFLLTERIFSRVFWFLMPSKRPMDNVKTGFDRPQEDEFAMCMLGAGSPYRTIAFPNHPPQCQEYLDLEMVSREGLRHWKQTFLEFLKRVTYKTRKRLVLKSPPHTARIKVLQEMFPGARFIHIVRDPFVVYPSTIKLWQTLYTTHGLQTPNFVGLEEHVLRTFNLMHERLQEGKRTLEPNQFCEVRYEDLTVDPIGEIKRIYEKLQLDGFEQCLPRLKDYLATVEGYETNKYQLTDAETARIMQRWGEYMRRYGYGHPAPAQSLEASHAG